MEREAKQVIVFRKDLLKGQHGIRKGKFAAQCAHASIGAVLDLMDKTRTKGGTEYYLKFKDGSCFDKWFNGAFAKVCLGVEDEKELLELYRRVKKESKDIPCVLITDAGRTEFHGVPTHTCVGIGPFWADEIDKFTGELKLL